MRAPLVLLACAVLGASGTLHAQARGPLSRGVASNAPQVEKPPIVLDEVSRARRITAMEAWLERLRGRFRVVAKRTQRDPFANRDISDEFIGAAECRGIGVGPGVRCLIAEPTPVAPENERRSDFSAPPLVYFGIDPDTVEIQAVVVEIAWVAARSGVLPGDTVAFSSDNWKDCQRIRFKTCWVISEITAKPAGGVFMKVHVDASGARTASGHTSDMELHLHREPGTGPSR